MTEGLPRKLEPSALVGRIPIVDTEATFAIALEPDHKGVTFKFGWLVGQGELLHCHWSGARQTPLEFIALLRAAVDSLEDQARAGG